jgi:membrane protein
MNRSKYWLTVTRQMLIRLDQDDCFGLAKGAAYSFLLFFFPLLLFLVIGMVMTDALTALAPTLTGGLSRIVPPETNALIANYITSMVDSEPTNLLVSAFLGMVWTGSGMMVTLMKGLDRAYRVPMHRPMVKQRLLAIGLVFSGAIPLVLLAILTIFGSHLERWILAQFNLTLPVFWKIARWAILLAATTAMISVVYHTGPNRRQSWWRVLPGAALATALWVMATLGFGAYVSRFGEYDVIYGSLGAAIVLLIWMYLSALVVLIGGEFNAVLESIAPPNHTSREIRGRSVADRGD